MKTIEQLIAKLVADPHGPNCGVIANDLLDLVVESADPNVLRPLLTSDNDALVETGIWISSELGGRAAPLIDVITTLLQHPLSKVRYYAVDAVLTCTQNNPDGRVIFSAVILMEDGDAAVRWKAMDFLARAESAQLLATYLYVEAHKPESKHHIGLSWLVNGELDDGATITERLRGGDAILRKYAIVGGARIASTNLRPLRDGAALDDADVADFAKNRIRLLTSKRRV